MRKAYLVGLVAAGSLVVGATAASAATAGSVTTSSYTAAAGNQFYPAAAGANVKKKRGADGVGALPFIIAAGVGATALFIALDDGDGSPTTAG